MQTHGRSDISSLLKLFSTLRECKNKWDCIMFEELFIRDLSDWLNRMGGWVVGGQVVGRGLWVVGSRSWVVGCKSWVVGRF